MSANEAPQMAEFTDLANMLVMQYDSQGFLGDKNRKSTKPLNAFMAFRAYYQGLFPGVEQKERSGYLTFLWQQEKDQARWTILAKAFTIVRDITALINAEKPKLNDFLVLNAPFVGLLLPPKDASPDETQQYLTHMGKSKNTVLVEEVLANSLAGGYLPGFTPVRTENKPFIVMAALPSNGGSEGFSNMKSPSNANPINQDEGTGQGATRENNIASQQDIDAQNSLDITAIDEHGNVHAVESSTETTEGYDASFIEWCEEYFQHVNDIHMAQLAQTLTYQGGVDDQEEFSPDSEVQTDFDPFAGDLWTTYDISAPVEDLLASLTEA